LQTQSIYFFELRVRTKITSHFSIPSSGHFCPIFNRKILEVLIASGFLWFFDFGSNKVNPNLGANSVKLFLREPSDSVQSHVYFGNFFVFVLSNGVNSKKTGGQ